MVHFEFTSSTEVSVPYETPAVIADQPFGDSYGYASPELTDLTPAASKAIDHVPEVNVIEQVVAPQTLEDYPSYFAKAARNPEQPQVVSDRAAGLVLDALAKYPQSATGAPALIADQLLDNFDSDPRSGTGVGMLEMARLVPDPEACADTTNRLHKAFHIPRVVGAMEAAAMVSSFAQDALEKIHTTTAQAIVSTGKELPTEIANDGVINRQAQGTLRGPWSVNKPAVDSLHALLTRAPALRMVVAEHIKTQADTLRADSRAQQQRAKNRMKLLQQFRPNQRY